MLRVLSRRLFCLCNLNIREYSGGGGHQLKIAVCGAAGRMGQIISLFLKQSHCNLDIALYDTSPALSSLRKQLQLINTRNVVSDFVGPLKIRFALKDADIVVVLVRSKTTTNGNTGDNFIGNMPVVTSIAKSCIEVCPDAVLAIATEPLNCIIPAVSELYRGHDFLHTTKIIGLSAADSMFASVVYANLYSIDPGDSFVPVIGGTSNETAIPLFSQGSPSLEKDITQEEFERLHGLFRVYKMQESSGFAAAFALTRLIQSIIRALLGEKDIVECAFVNSPEGAPVKYMNTLIDLGESGIENVYGPPTNLNKWERKMINPAFSTLQRDIELAEKYIANNKRSEVRIRW